MPAILGALVASLSLAACLERPLCTDCAPATTNAFVETVPQKLVNKVDLLFVIDNSRSMADKQQVLSEAVPDLVRRLVNPDCVAPEGGARARPDERGNCPAGLAPEFQSVKDIHIGVITSSLGGPTCGEADDPGPLEVEQRDDRGHLVGGRPRFAAEAAKLTGLDAPAPPGFLDWNPKLHPDQKGEAFNATFTLMTKVAGEIGCGYEAQLESFYRFLVDPVPPASVEILGEPTAVRGTIKRGTDQALLAQRKAFLRPDSLVAVILLTDENDCSIRDQGDGIFATLGDIQRGSAACGANPNDPCCYPCGQPVPPNCTADPTCSTHRNVDRNEDHMNLRCFDQKRRFGYDFLYPTARYVNALTLRKLCVSNVALDGAEEGRCPDGNNDGSPDVFDNPLYTGSAESLPRSKDLVFLAGIVGVPWQDIAAAKDADGNDYPPAELHFKPASTMSGDGTWDKILGVPHPPNGAPPLLPTNRLMIEQREPRTGTDGQGNLLGSADGPWNHNPVNGHEWNNLARNDLQYACTFPLPPDPVTKERSRDCTKDHESCDCDSTRRQRDADPVKDNNPLCQDPQTNRYGTTQFRAKAYPGLRELEVLQGYGKNSIVASICARNVDQPSLQDYGYGPAVDAIVDRLKDQLSDRCLPRVLEKDATGRIPCSVVEVLRPDPTARCDSARGRLPLDATLKDNVRGELRKLKRCDVPNQPACEQLLLCELQEVQNENCHRATSDQPQPGWCYIDPATQPGDDPSLVKKCRPHERRIMRFVDSEGATPAPNAEVFIACFGAGGSRPQVTPAGAQ